MLKKQPAFGMQTRNAEGTEELVGVLTAISVVSKRLARKLALLEQIPARKDGEKSNARKPASLSGDAD